MVGTTRPRISLFMEGFRKHGLIETNLDRFLVIHEKKLADYLAARPAREICARRDRSGKKGPVLDSNRFGLSVH
jgi:hypothetical protein